MALKEITEHILKDAKTKAAEIRKEAEERASEILNEAAGRAEEEGKRILSNAQRRAAEEKKRLIAMAKLEARNMILSAKQNKIQAVFDRVLRSVVELPEKEYLEIFRSMLTKAATGGEEVIVNERDRKHITPEFLSQIDPSLGLSPEARDISGGFVLKSGRIETNSSFEVLLSSARREIEPEVLKILFTA